VISLLERRNNQTFFLKVATFSRIIPDFTSLNIRRLKRRLHIKVLLNSFQFYRSRLDRTSLFTLVMQRCRMVYHEIFHKSLVFSWYTQVNQTGDLRKGYTEFQLLLHFIHHANVCTKRDTFYKRVKKREQIQTSTSGLVTMIITTVGDWSRRTPDDTTNTKC